MSSRSWFSLVGSAGVKLGLSVRRVARAWARVERGLVEYLSLTPSRRRTSRVAGIVLFGCMSVGLMGTNECESCRPVLTAAFGTIVADYIIDKIEDSLDDDYVRGVAHPNFTGTDGSQTGVASFQGNFTAITEPGGSYFLLARNPDCSLGMITGTSPLDGTANIQGLVPNYERVLHQVAGLTTTPDVFAKGCAGNSAGISSRLGALVGKTTQGVMVSAVVSSASTNAVYVLNVSANLSTITLNPAPTLPYAAALATEDLNGDHNGDLVVVNGYGTASPNISVMLGNADGTFQNPVTYPVGGSQYTVAAVIDDVNNDGKLDIVTVSNDQQISVLLGNGDGTFQAATSFAAPTLPGYTSNASTPILGLITADVNGDGKKDIVCSDGAVLLGAGNGTFTAVATAAFPYTSANPGGFGVGMASGDINNDGKVDLVVDTGPTNFTYLGNGTGTFTPGASYAAINNSGYVTVSDLDGDGNLDIYTGLANGGLYSGDDTQNATAYVLMGNGDGTFVGAPRATGAYTGNNLGDVNGDGIPDLITGYTVQLGTGKGTFATKSTITIPTSFSVNGTTYNNATLTGLITSAVADVNGDGKADYVFVDSNYPAFYFVAISNGDGTFQPGVPHALPQIAPAADFDISLTVSGLEIADFNHDGRNDLIYTYNEIAGTSFGQPTVTPYNQGFAVLLGSGGGLFSTTPVFTPTYTSNNPPPTGFVPALLSVVDLNGDNKPDLIVNAPGTSIVNFQLQTLFEIYVGNGDGSFKPPTTLATADEYGLPVVADFNKDGKLDLAWLAETTNAQAELVVALGNGDGTFGTPAITNLTGGDAIRDAALAGADFNGDGNPDLALLDANDFSGVFYGKGDGTFTSVPGSGYVVPKDLISLDAPGTAVAVALTKDGRTDILAGTTVLLNLYGAAPVIPATTTLGLTASAVTIASGGSIKFTATITPAAGSTATPTGTVTFYNGTSSIGTGTVTAGVATLTTTALTVAGTDTISAVYGGDANFSGSPSGQVSVTVTASSGTTTALAVSPGTTFNQGANITLTATVTPVSSSTAPTGTVTFYLGTTSLGTATLASGVASLSTTAVTTPGAQNITAQYGGDTNYSGSISAPLAVTVVVPVGTTISLTANATAVAVGTSVTLTATVAAVTGSAVPTGTVTFYDSNGTITLGTGTLNGSGVAAYTTSALAVGTHAVSAKYAGATGFLGANSGGFSILVTAAGIATTTSVTANATTSTLGTGFIFTTTVTPASGTAVPTGAVNILDGVSIIGTVAVGTTNVAVFSTNMLAVGTHSITAAYTGSSTFGASTSAPVKVTVTAATAASTKTTLSGVVSPPASGSVATLTAVVTPAIGSGIPTGTVTFTNNGSVTLGTVTLDGTGTAVLNTTNLVAGTGADTVIATYNGSSSYNGSISNSLVLTYVAATPTLLLTPGAATLSFAPGATTGNSTTITIAPSGGFTGSVTLTAAVTQSPTGAIDLPAPSFGATSPVNITGAGSGSGTLTVATTAPVSGAAVVPVRPGVRYAPVALAGLLLLVLPRRRQGLRVVLGLLLFFGVLGGVMGCGGHPSASSNTTGSPGTTAGNYTITVTATAGSVTAQTTVAVTVQ